MRKMLLKHKEPNYLNFFEIRRAKVPPPWFDYINIPLRYNMEQTLTKWIEENLKGRFYIGRSTQLSPETNSPESVCKIGFENQKELSYFTLACPYLKYQ